MTKRGVLIGDWTHRRGDPGGARAIAADVTHSKPEIAWTWRPPHGGHVDQVRVAGNTVFVATMAPAEKSAPGWERATVYALDAASGRVIASRALPDPAPVASMIVAVGALHVVVTRRGEPIHRYVLDAQDLSAKDRRAIELDRDARREDVLDAWATPDGGMWLEVEGAQGATGGRAYAFLGENESAAVTQTHVEDVATADWGSPARDACVAGQVLFVPVAATRPLLWRVEPKAAAPYAVHEHAVASARARGHARPDANESQGLVAPATEEWARAEIEGPRARMHALVAEGTVHAIAFAVDAERDDRAAVQALAIDKDTGTVRWRSAPARVALRAPLGDGARVARRSNGEVLAQALDAEGAPATDLVCAREGEEIGTVALGAGRYMLDAALGDIVLAHADHDKKGRVTVAAFAIDREGLLLGRRSTMRWSIDVDDLGHGTTIYPGAGHVVVRGSRAIAALAV